VNVTFDAHCRYMLVRSGAKAKIESTSSRLRDPTCSQLADTAIKNFGVSVPGDVQSEVERALASGVVKRVAAPQAQRSTAVDDAFAGLGDLLGDSGANTRYTPAPRPTPTRTGRDPLDDLDDLLESVPAHVKTYTPPPLTSHRPADDFGFSSGGGFSAPPSRPAQSGLDDIDLLLSDMGPSHHKHHGGGGSSGLDDIDSLLADIGGPKSSQRAPAAESIDDLLNSFGPPPTNNRNNNFSAIDDILNGF